MPTLINSHIFPCDDIILSHPPLLLVFSEKNNTSVYFTDIICIIIHLTLKSVLLCHPPILLYIACYKWYGNDKNVYIYSAITLA